ncbi:nuclear pore complex protein NUP214 isoform X2 [Sesamum indicum]|uniref:Nuclear pore complex protein NUP214 isoform X2 n=1 Tax=Sesamum indicum TaxID=4182 RepID=A0A8M8UZJ8_SESIN|nr:nuclear pore complex protein NUP214 isoform X2 [Sesamum indicum]
MANPPLLDLTTDGAPLFELDDEIDGDEVGSRNYRFCKVGEPVPIKSDDSSEFDPQCLPSQPLAVSERFRLLFVAHPQGFCVARTKDVMASAEEIKEKQTGPSVQELSLVDVSIGKVSILALSSDDSLLAVTIGNHVHFFAVSALLHKDQKPSYSVSLDDSICIKDMRWARKVAKAYVILSDDGKLYHGSGQGPPSYVMEGVDSVDWSVKGNFVAVAKKNIVSILSSEFEEKLRFLLQFQSVVGDSDVNQVIKVDSIRWIRPDCLAVGCFQLNDDGEEENYIVQVITTRGRKITDAAAKPIVLSFNNVFMDFSSDAVPIRNGPHLFLSYLDLYGLAFIANRNLSQHVGLFCWSLDSGKNEAAVIEILNDAWNLYIDTQVNGEENVIMGLSVDKVSQNENVRFTLGDEETEVSPCCLIVCQTIDGKISVFHFASARGALASSEVCADEEEDDSQASTNHQLSVISSAGGEESRVPTSLPSESHEFSRVAIGKTGAKATITNELSPSFHLDGRSQEQTYTENTGQKPLTNSQMVKVKVDEPEKALSTKQNQDSNPEYQSISEVKRSTGFFTAEVVGDSFQQSMSNYSISGRNVEPLGKVPPTSSPSGWSLTRSNARVDSSKPSTGKFLSFPSGEIGNSDKPALQSGGGVERRATDLKEKAKPSVSFTSFGQTDSSAQGNRNSLPGSPGSQASLTESVASGKSFPSEFKKELSAAPSPAGFPYSAQKVSKQFGNVEEMARKLDKLLEGIEGKGGFRDASITSQTHSVVELEDCIWALSDRCRTWRGLMDERSKEVQLLLDKTIQVLVRKVYMEGIFKQATDSRYWELWNRQKLSSEMELKRRRILELNQELTTKLIELERHFNSLEFNKFGEDGGMPRNRRVLQNSHRHSRQIQPLHILHNTTHAQLAAAEQLSGCLSKQMAALSIESSGKHDMKKQLFESIGLSYVGDTMTSPTRTRTSSTPSDQKHFIASGYIASKQQSRRNQASSAKSYEPETARRRRDSLDRTWANFDPPKTTVKRMLKEDSEKGSANRSLFNMDKQYLSPQLQKKSEVAHSALLNLSGGVNHYQSRGTAEIPVKESTQSPSSSLPQRTAGLLGRGMQVSSTKQISALPPPSILETRTTQSSEVGVFKLIDEKSKSSLPFTGKNDSFAPNESKLVQRFDTSFHPLPSMSGQMPEHSLTPPSSSTESLDHFKIGFTKSNTLNPKSTSMASDTTLFDSKIPITPASSFSSGSNVSVKGLFTKNSEKTSQPYDGLSVSTQLQSVSSNSLPSLSAFVSKPSSLTLSPVTPSSSGASVAAKEVPQPQTSVPSTVNFPSMLSLSTHENNLSSISPSSSIKNPESLTSLSVPSIAKYGSETEGVLQTRTSVAHVPSKVEEDVKIQASASQPGLAITASDLKFGPLPSTAPSELSINSKSGSKIDFGDSSKSSSVTSAIKLELPSATEALSPVALSSEGIGDSAKNVVSESSHEEMEEEAPETDQTAGFALGNFVGFGIGSTSDSTAPKSKPFGVAVLNKSTTSAPSQYMAPASGGELFRPASFNFQSPQPPEPLQPPNVANFSGGSGIPGQVSAGAGFGQPAHVGVGQQALGSVLGTFGQSRQLGAGLPGSGVASASGFGSGFVGTPAGGFGVGFASASSGGGFGSLASGAGGFAAAATVGGGFAAAATAGGGFAGAASAGGGFAAAASAGGGFGAAASAGGGFGAAASAGGGFGSSTTSGAVSGGGFGAFSNQQGSGGGFSAFAGGSGVGRPPSELFTQMRK